MNSKAKKARNIIIGIIIAVIAAVALVIIFISPIAKYLIEKYDVKYLGREITLDWIYVNPFTGYAHIHNLKVYEAGGKDTVFFSAKGASVNFAMLKLFTKTYEIENITLTSPWGRAVQDHKKFNFNDIIERFQPKDTVKKVKGPPAHFSILNMKITDGEFHYEALSIPVSYYIKHVNISCPGYRWDVDSMTITCALQSGPAQGDLKAVFNLNLRTLEYSASAQINKYDLKFIEQYLRDFSNYGSFTANVDGDVQATGNLGIKLAVQAKGWIAINRFHFGKVPGEDYLSFDRLMLSMVDVNPREFSYYIDTIRIDKPFFKYERYDHMDNIAALFGKDMKNIKDAVADQSHFNLVIEIGKYVNDIVKNFMKSYYKINRVAIWRGDFRFNDFSLRERFSVAADPLTITADSIDKNHRRMNIRLATAVNPYGGINVALSLDPNNYGTFELNYKIEKIPVSLFNPYLLTYTSFPLDRGSLDFNGYMNVVDSNINSDNHLLILDPRVGKRLKRKDTKWVPMPLIMSIVRERSGAIDYDIPIRGSLRSPKFKFRYVILDILGNIFIKPPSTPYLYHVTEVEKSVEKFMTVTWETRSTTLRPGQEKFVEKMAGFLQKTHDATIEISPMEYADKEKEYILFFEAKKKFWLRGRGNKTVSESDSLSIEKMSIKDPVFVRFLDTLVGDTPMFTIQEKCKYYLGGQAVAAGYARLVADRQRTFMGFFSSDAAERVKIKSGQAIVPFDGFSYYKIEYNGEIPKKLLDTYDEISEINEDPPRRQYLKARTENGGPLPDVKVPPKK